MPIGDARSPQRDPKRRGYAIENRPKLRHAPGVAKCRECVHVEHQGRAPRRTARARRSPGRRQPDIRYGHHDVSDSKSTKFERRSADLTLRKIFPQALMLKRKTGIRNGGDSGGPLFCEGKVVGIVSCGKDGPTFDTDDYYARLSTVNARIAMQLKKWGD